MKYAWRVLLENFKSTNLILIALEKSYDCLFNCKLGAEQLEICLRATEAFLSFHV